MKQYFRIYVNFEQNDWIILLFIIEFIYNNNINALINCSSFEINLNFFYKWVSKSFSIFELNRC